MRNEYYEEALDLCTHVKQMQRKHQNIPIVKVYTHIHVHVYTCMYNEHVTVILYMCMVHVYTYCSQTHSCVYMYIPVQFVLVHVCVCVCVCVCVEYLGGCGEVKVPDAEPAASLTPGLHPAASVSACGGVPPSNGVFYSNRTPTPVPAGPGLLVDLCTLRHPSR